MRILDVEGLQIRTYSLSRRLSSGSIDAGPNFAHHPPKLGHGHVSRPQHNMELRLAHAMHVDCSFPVEAPYLTTGGIFRLLNMEKMPTRASSVRMSLYERNYSLATIFTASRSAFRNLNADWSGGCVTFFRFTWRAAGRPHCVNTCPCARPASSALLSLACWSIVNIKIYIYHELCDESDAVEKIDIRCQLLML